MKLSSPLYQLLVSGRGNTPDVKFPGGTADYITVHMTGNRSRGADAAAHANWMFTNAPYSWHVTVDDEEAWQSIEWSMQGWHAGDGGGPGNVESIGIEVCMYDGIDQEKAYSNAAELVAYLLEEGHGAKGVVQHNHWTGKNCPELIRAAPGRWERFIDQVQAFRLEAEEEEMGMTDDEKLALFAGREQIAHRPTREERLKYANYRIKEIAEGKAPSLAEIAAAWPPSTYSGAVPPHRHVMEVAIASTGPVIP